MQVSLSNFAEHFQNGTPKGITSVCSAQPPELRTALRSGRDIAAMVLIEATCNQVNHQGGYTGLSAQTVSEITFGIAKEEARPVERIILGGDHLGPNPWRHLCADAAMGEAPKMVEAYVKVGFQKLHLDTSMGCSGETEALGGETTARRAAHLARVAETAAHAADLNPPIYAIGTEVPPPSGANHALSTIKATSPQAARHTLAVHRRVFGEHDLEDAFSRIVGLVVQSSLEFGNQNVITYNPTKSQDLTNVLKDYSQIIFEAHSTDYQGKAPITQLVKNGFSILKVGPELTFVLREAFYALDLIASDLVPEYENGPLYATMESLMTAQPDHWQRHYSGSEAERRILRHYSLSDRIRYYWTAQTAQAAVAETLRGRVVPLPVIWQHLPGGDVFADKPLNVDEVIIWRVRTSLQKYQTACEILPKRKTL